MHEKRDVISSLELTHDGESNYNLHSIDNMINPAEENQNFVSEAGAVRLDNLLLINKARNTKKLFGLSLNNKRRQS